MDKSNKRKLPPLHPGIHIEEEILYLGLTKVKTATILGISRQYLDRVLKGNASINVSIATRLAAAFGSTAKVWMSLQADYDIWNYISEHKEELEHIECYV